MSATNIDLGVFVRLHDKLIKPLKRTEDRVSASSKRMNRRLSLSMKLAGAGAIAAGIAAVTKKIITASLEPVRAVEKAKGELASLGIKQLKLVTDMGKKMESRWAGVSAEAFTRAAYDIKSGISSLTDQGVADMTRAAVTVAKATKGVPEEMTSLFATGYGIFKQQYEGMRDADFGALFGDMISASVQQFKTDGAQMQAAIENVGNTGVQIGQKMSETFAALGVLQGQMGGAEAGTALKAFNLSAGKAQGAFEKMGFSIRTIDADGTLMPIADIMRQINAETASMGSVERQELLRKAFGSEEALRAIGPLLENTDALGKQQEALEKAARSGGKFTEGMAKATDNNFDARMEVMSQKWNVIKMTLGEKMIPVIDKVAPAFEKAMEALTNFADAHPNLVGGIAAAVVVLAGVASVVAPILIGMAAMTIALPTLTAGFAVVTGALAAMKLALLANPIILIVAAIAAAAYLIYDNWDAIAGFFSDLWQQIKMAWEPVGQWFGALWEDVKSVFSGMFTVIKAIVMTFTPVGIIYKHWDSITAWFAQLWDGVKAVFSTLVSWTKTALITFTPVGLIYQHWDGISAFFSGVWNSVKSVFAALVSWGASALLNFTPAGLIYKHWDSIAAWFAQLWNGVKSVFSGVWGVIKSAAEGNFNPANIIYAKWGAITAWFSDLWARVKTAFSTRWENIKAMISTWPAKMMQAGKDIVQGVIDGITTRWAALRNKITAMGSAVVGWFRGKRGIDARSPSRIFTRLGGYITDGLNVGIDRGTAGVTRRMAGLARKIAQPVTIPPIRSLGRIAAPLAAVSAAPALAVPSVASPSAIAGSVAAQVTPAGPSLAQQAVRDIVSSPSSEKNITIAPQYDLSVTLSGGASAQDEQRIRDLFQQLTDEHVDKIAADVRRALHD